ncbi:CRISPR-associated endonuclease Cas3'' [Haladaptatus sp. DYF46]|uniref:CRISPR-associated endonuclease Cas3'' n=1 Tax=Haladaptatus sp. DYF46 TaxID=2886041 RepID=UPI001E304A79|nr:CRISPR-associated endonuclease Cas3'' [Haladaptatus sp. DYF46]
MGSTYTTKGEIIARPGQTHWNHTNGVVKNVDTLLSTTGLGKDEAFRKTVRTIAYLHDLGKLTQFFQQYIHKDDPREPAKKDRYHSLSGAFVTLHALKSLHDDPEQPDIPQKLRIAAFYAVAKHHLSIENFTEEQEKYTHVIENGDHRFQRYDRVRKQLENIDAHTAPHAAKLIETATDGALTWSNIYIERPFVYSELLNWKGGPSEDFYALVLELWSLLTCADKMNAAGMGIPTESPASLSPKAIQGKINTFPTPEATVQKTLNELRNDARKEAQKRIQEGHQGDDQVFTLTLPTGFGKTFAGLEAALTLAEAKDGRVIYALPYTSVIDQTDDVIQSVFNIQSGSSFYTKHHHLTDTRTTIDDVALKDHPSTGDEVLYGETWLASLVLTTFVQLFESIAGPANTQSIKLPAIQDSVIVVDEPQALSMEWWHLITRLTSILVEDYNATVIFMTATQPRIVSQISNDLSPVPLIADRTPYLSFLETHPRVDYQLDDSLIEYLEQGASATPRSPASATDQIATDVLTAEERETALAICNTVQSAQALGQRLTKQFNDVGGSTVHLGEHLLQFFSETDWVERIYAATTSVEQAVERDEPASDQEDSDEMSMTQRAAMAYLDYLGEVVGSADRMLATLTTRLRPVDRAILIECLRLLLDADHETSFTETSIVVTSTQLVEAGVDVSFNRLYRDFAPLPSLVQAAGRCNRSYDGDDGTVVLWRLAGEANDIPPSQLIYGSLIGSEDGERDRDLLAPTRYALNAVSSTDRGGTTSLPEHVMISQAVEEYYTSVHKRERSKDRDDKLAKKVDLAAGEDLRHASLIRQDYETIEILIPSEVEQAYLNRYHELKEQREFEKADAVFSALKQALVTIPVTKRTQPILDRLSFEEERTFHVLCSADAYTLIHGLGIMPTALGE